MLSVRVDDRVRLASSAVSLTKRFGGIQSWAYPHPLRMATVDFLAKFKNHPCVRFFDEIAEHRFMNAFYGLAVLCTQPPNIRWKYKDGPALPEDDPLREKIVANFPLLMSEFFKDTNISSLWEQRKKEWETAVAQCKSIHSSYDLAGWLRSFYGETQLDLVLVPNPIDPCSMGFGPSIENEKYAIIGPVCVSKQRKASYDDFSYLNDPAYVVRTAFHEFSHGILGRILDANERLVKSTEHLATRNKLRGYFLSSYPTWDIQLEEILIPAFTALFISDTEGEAAGKEFLEEEKREYGIFLVEDLYFELKYYNEKRKAEQAKKLSDYLPIIFDSLNDK